MIGERFGRLSVIGVSRDTRKKALCRCDCGDSAIVRIDHLKSGRSRSCGCLRREVTRQNKTRHGMARRGRRRSPEYAIWSQMIERCHNPNNDGYPMYGGRGIAVCDKWRRSFESFFSHVGRRPSDSHSIDRIDVDGDYEPGNVRWATAKEQGRNTRRNRVLTFDGRSQCLAAWAEETGIAARVIRDRLSKHHWTIERALTTPARKR